MRAKQSFAIVLSAIAIVAVAAAPAKAHPDVDEGRRLAQQADLDGATAAFDRAEASGSLAKGDLVALLEGRALVAHALGDREALRRSVSALASIAPEHAMGRDMPPDVRRAFDEARAGSRGAIAIEVSERGDVLEASVVNDVAGIVREVRAHRRAAGAAWEIATGRAATTMRADGAIEYYVLAIGPGGAVVASLGSLEAPRRYGTAARLAPLDVARESTLTAPVEVSPETAPATSAMTSAGPGDEDDRGPGAWPWIVGGAVVAGAVTVALLLLLPGDTTQPSFPRHPL